MIRMSEDGLKLIKKIEDCIVNKNFETFSYLRKVLNELKDEEGSKLTFLPDTAIIHDSETDEVIGTLDITIKENFEKIDEGQWECG